MECNKKIGDKILLSYSVPFHKQKYYYRVIREIHLDRVLYKSPGTWDYIVQVNKSRIACTIDFIFYPYLKYRQGEEI